MFWGLTPALDLLEELQKSDNEEINILILGAHDFRHILKTLASRHKHAKMKINFYVMEALMETVAKELLLLNIALQPPTVLGLEMKTRVFMELYGNTLVSPKTQKILLSVAKEMIEMVVNYEYMNEMMPFVNLDLLYKERDSLENIVKYWASDQPFDVVENWDKKLRSELGVRYDNKFGVFDWDLHMRFHNIGGKQVCVQEFKRWRATGVAFTFLDMEVSKCNATFAIGVTPHADRFIHFGYFGDVETGPYVSFGLECDDPDFLKQTNGLNKHRATDVTQRNVQQILHELQSDEKYVHQATHDYNLGAAVFDDKFVQIRDDVCASFSKLNKIKKCTNLDDVTINILSITRLKHITNKKNFQNFFNLIYFGAAYLKYYEKDAMEHIAADNSVLIVETNLFVLKYRDTHLETQKKDLVHKVSVVESVVEIPFDHAKDSYAKFILKTEKKIVEEVVNEVVVDGANELEAETSVA